MAELQIFAILIAAAFLPAGLLAFVIVRLVDRRNKKDFEAWKKRAWVWVDVGDEPDGNEEEDGK